MNPSSEIFTVIFSGVPFEFAGRVLNTARYLSFNSGVSAIHAMSPSRLNNCLLPVLRWFTANTSSFVKSDSVKSSSLVMSPPMMSGERAMLHSVIRVNCSSRVNFVGLPKRILPSGNMSASGQCPGPMNGDHLRNRSNWS